MYYSTLKKIWFCCFFGGVGGLRLKQLETVSFFRATKVRGSLANVCFSVEKFPFVIQPWQIAFGKALLKLNPSKICDIFLAKKGSIIRRDIGIKKQKKSFL